MIKSKNPYQDMPSAELCSADFARQQDAKDVLSKLRAEFVIPTQGDLSNRSFGFQHTKGDGPRSDNANANGDDDKESIYFCGNSLGLQPRRTKEYVNRYLDTWASKGVFGHFTEYHGGLPPWLHIDDAVKEQSAKLVGAMPSEVCVMETLTANLHLLMASFYRPTTDRWKIIIEGKAFPSDHVCALQPRPTHFHSLTSTVCGSFTDSPPQFRPVFSHYNRSTFCLRALPLQRTHSLRHLPPCCHNSSRLASRHPILLGPILRH
jgi:kynureninase